MKQSQTTQKSWRDKLAFIFNPIFSNNASIAMSWKYKVFLISAQLEMITDYLFKIPPITGQN